MTSKLRTLAGPSHGEVCHEKFHALCLCGQGCLKVAHRFVFQKENTHTCNNFFHSNVHVPEKVLGKLNLTNSLYQLP